MEAIRKRLGDQALLLMETGAAMDEARLHQEAAFLAAKADIREEIDRLRTHVEAARTLLAGGRGRGAQARFPLPGIYPRSQHALLEIQCGDGDRHRPRI